MPLQGQLHVLELLQQSMLGLLNREPREAFTPRMVGFDHFFLLVEQQRVLVFRVVNALQEKVSKRKLDRPANWWVRYFIKLGNGQIRHFARETSVL
jgi:hypothetical protein